MLRTTIKKYLLSVERTPRTPQPRASKLDPYKPTIAGLLQRDSATKSEAIFHHLRSLGYDGGRSILRDYVQRVRVKSLGPAISGTRQEAFDWMRAVQQGALGQSDLGSPQKQLHRLGEIV